MAVKERGIDRALFVSGGVYRADFGKTTCTPLLPLTICVIRKSAVREQSE
jgi:hypothetical protein